ncbi:ABC transporter permease [Profundibacterium mesophilum]|uniref:Transport permease protein n=1 Tax=Profundibacterium mesophilum KAUST100406-0324 TaxID=1037889 RepID=A0A921NTR3_9RHOB|nr:ABC transporter permease [Profundibacterium mesophilum]KAF0674589.1 ABC polysaccharide export transporter inner membrane subunit [Profundibacterium mesophilum KAUST100406-0324]
MTHRSPIDDAGRAAALEPTVTVPAAQVPHGGRRIRPGTMRTVAALILREMSTRYGRTPGGYLWAILEPLGAVLILSFGFALLLRTPSLGNSFLLFYASGFLPFNLYMVITNMVARSLLFSRPLLAYPAVTWLDAILARFLLNTLTGLLVSYLLFAGILIFTDARVVIDIGPLVGAMLLAALLGLGVGALNCLLMGLYPTWEMFWGIVTRPLFLASGVIFIYEDLPAGAQNVLWYNPLMHVTGLMRTGLYPMYNPEYLSWVYVLGCALAPLMMGLLLLRRHYKTILNI